MEGSSSDETQFASPPGAIPYHLTDAHEVVNVDSERSLVVIRASKGSTDLSMGDGHFSASLAVDAFEIEDLLVGPRCPTHAYLARSFVATREQLPQALRSACACHAAHALLHTSDAISQSAPTKASLAIVQNNNAAPAANCAQGTRKSV